MKKVEVVFQFDDADNFVKAVSKAKGDLDILLPIIFPCAVRVDSHMDGELSVKVWTPVHPIREKADATVLQEAT